MGKLVLTPEEKRVLLFVLFALVIGLGVKAYRDHRPGGSRLHKSNGTNADAIQSGR